jgi:hypothetical protein
MVSRRSIVGEYGGAPWSIVFGRPSSYLHTPFMHVIREDGRKSNLIIRLIYPYHLA